MILKLYKACLSKRVSLEDWLYNIGLTYTSFVVGYIIFYMTCAYWLRADKINWT